MRLVWYCSICEYERTQDGWVFSPACRNQCTKRVFYCDLHIERPLWARARRSRPLAPRASAVVSLTRHFFIGFVSEVTSQHQKCFCFSVSFYHGVFFLLSASYVKYLTRCCDNLKPHGRGTRKIA